MTQTLARLERYKTPSSSSYAQQENPGTIIIDLLSAGQKIPVGITAVGQNSINSGFEITVPVPLNDNTKKTNARERLLRAREIFYSKFKYGLVASLILVASIITIQSLWVFLITALIPG